MAVEEKKEGREEKTEVESSLSIRSFALIFRRGNFSKTTLLGEWRRMVVPRKAGDSKGRQTAAGRVYKNWSLLDSRISLLIFKDSGFRILVYRSLTHISG